MIVYLIKNIKNGKMYVGKTIKSAEERFMQHQYNASIGIETYLYRAIRIYGKESFVCQTLETCCLDSLNEREIFWIEYLKPQYNMTSGGDGGDTSKSEKYKLGMAKRSLQISGSGNPFYGKKHSKETKDKISASKIGIKLSIETVEKIRLASIGRKVSIENIAKIIERQSKTYYLIDSKGNKIKVVNMTQFAKDNGLDQGNMTRMYSGIYKSSKGFKRDYESDPLEIN